MSLIKKEIKDYSKLPYWFNEENEKVIKIKKIDKNDIIEKRKPVIVWPFILT